LNWLSKGLNVVFQWISYIGYAFFESNLTEATKLQEYAANIDIHLEIESEGRLRTKLYDKRDDFNFPIVNFHSYVATFQQHLHNMVYISLS